MQSQHMVNQSASRLSGNMTAAQRFFSLPELVSLLCTCCSTEQIDLITLASLSRFLRAIALPHWARYLDVALSTADKKLNFFIANTSLLSHIRYLRIRDDIDERQREYRLSLNTPSERADVVVRPHWGELKLLLAMIVAHSSSLHRPPAIDITIGLTQVSTLQAAFRPFSRLHHQIVALRTFIDVDFSEIDELEEHEYEEIWHQSWTVLARFIKIIHEQGCSPSLQSHGANNRSPSGSASGLRHFHLKGNHREVPDVPLDFWRSFSAATASSLRTLGLSCVQSENIWHLLAHRQLSRFYLVSHASGPSDSLDGFLDQIQSTLEDLHLSIGDAQASLTFRQDFPRLQYFGCQDAHTNLKLFFEFILRHPQLKGIFNNRLKFADAPRILSRGVCPNLRVLDAMFDVYEEFALQGRRSSHLRLPFEPNPEKCSYGWLLHTPDAAKAITCLELPISDNVLHSVLNPEFRPPFASEFLPNLTELAIRFGSSDGAFGSADPESTFGNPLSERDLARIFGTICFAKSLRVLHLSASRAASFEKNGDLLAGFPDVRFPSHFEYFTWFTKSLNETQYYRFVPSEEQDSPPNGSKRGRLQPISSFFRTRITKEGVWESAFDSESRRIIYDHTPLDGPVMDLS